MEGLSESKLPDRQERTGHAATRAGDSGDGMERTERDTRETAHNIDSGNMVEKPRDGHEDQDKADGNP